MSSRHTSVLLRHIHQLAGRPFSHPLPDGQLLERFVADREEAAFAALVARHGPMVLRACQRVLHDTHAAEDAFQATFLVLVRKARSIGQRERLGNWLYGVASRVARRAKVEAAKCRERESHSASQPREDAATLAGRHELGMVLDEELTRLPERLRAPFNLCFVEGRTRDQAARELGWPLRTLQRRLEQGRGLLRSRLLRRGVTLSATLLVAELSSPPARAGLSSLLVDATVKAASHGCADHRAASAKAVALAEAVFQEMAAIKPKVAALLVLGLSIVVAAGAMAQQLATDKEPPATAAPAEAKARRTDQYGDPLPEGALLRLGTVRFRADQMLGSVAYAPDGKTLATGEYLGTIRLWDATSGKEIRQFRDLQSGRTPTVAFSPDGAILASTSSNALVMWEVATGKEVRRFHALLAEHSPYGGEVIVPLVFSPDGKVLASAAPDDSVRLWDIETGKERLKLSGYRLAASCLAFSPDGKAILAGGPGQEKGSFYAWDASSGKELYRLALGDRPSFSVEPLAVSPDGKVVAVNVPEKEAVQLIELPTGRLLRSLECKELRLSSAVFSSDNHTLVAQARSKRFTASHVQSENASHVLAWDVSTGQRRFTSRACIQDSFLSSLRCLAVSPDGKTVASLGSGTSVHLWDLASGEEELAKPEAHHHRVRDVAFSPDGRTLATASADQTIALWDTATGQRRRTLEGHEGEVNALAFSPDGKLLATSGRYAEQSVRVWDVETGKQPYCFLIPMVAEGNGHRGVETWIGFLSGGKVLAACGTDRLVRCWDMATGKELLNTMLHRGGVGALPDIRDIDPSWWLHQIHGVSFTPAGNWLAVATRDVHLVDTVTGQVLFRTDPHGDASYSLALSPDGQTFTCAERDEKQHWWLRLLEAATGKEILRMGPLGELRTVAFSRDGRTLAAATDEATSSRITLFDVRTGKELLQFRGHDSRVNRLTFSRDGTKLASGQSDSTALIWDLTPARREPLPVKDLSPAELDQLWTDLKSDDAAKAHAAIWALVAAPDTAVPFLKDHLRPAPKVSEERLRRLISRLDSAEFAERDEAMRDLKKLGVEAVPALREALAGKPELEMKRRLEKLLEAPLPQTEMTPESLRQVRAIHVLDQIGSSAARQALESLTRGAQAAPETRAAREAQERLAQ
jgi:RNA polymerase sigma factor (sigma-70 family)